MGGQNLCDWYKIRLKRIALPYAIYFCLQCVIFALLGILDFKLELWNISTLGFWVDHTGTWYIALLLPLYILTPFLYKLLDTGDLKRWMIAITICVTLTIINHPSMNPCSEGVFSDIISNIQFAFVRVPSFVLGMSLAPYVKSSKKIDSLFTIGGMIGLTIFYHFLFRSASFEFIVVLPICMMICLICNVIKKIKIVDCVLTTLGSVSLELYLTNGTFQTAMHNIAERIDLGALARGRYFEYFMVIALGIMLSLSMQRLSSLISNNSRK